MKTLEWIEFIRRRTFCLPTSCQNMKIKTDRNITGHIVLCGCETWSPTMEKLMLRMYENGVLRKTVGLSGQE